MDIIHMKYINHGWGLGVLLQIILTANLFSFDVAAWRGRISSRKGLNV